MLSLGILIRQVLVILVVSRLVGWLFSRMAQPQVLGEMAAGLLLGPSLLGWVLPQVSDALFPSQSLGYLNAISLLGLLLFMFLVGLELDITAVRRLGAVAVVTSQAAIAVPFLLGCALAPFLYGRLAEPGAPYAAFILFLGAAMSVTAFPVLARILVERALVRTRVGTLALACAAVGDVVAWSILAAIAVYVRAGNGATQPVWVTIGGSAAFTAAMLTVGRRLLSRLENSYRQHSRITSDTLAVVVFLMLGCAWTTEWLGIHALFGAFLLGVACPRSVDFVEELTAKFEPVTIVLLLPLFFAFTGLRASLTLLNSGEMWAWCGIIIGVAVLGKLVGTTAAARCMGVPGREATALGILMNTRGLIELVILNIGMDLKILSVPLFSMMVLMALVTTAMTSPLLEWVYPRRLALVDTPTAEADTLAQGA